MEQFLNFHKIINPEEIQIIEEQWKRGLTPGKILEGYTLRCKNLTLKNQLLEKFKHSRAVKERTYNLAKKQGAAVNVMVDRLDEISINNLCLTPENQLKQVCLQDLKSDIVSKNCILWVTVIADPYKNAGFYLLLEDDNYDVIEAQIFNSVLFDDFQEIVDKLVRSGFTLGIKNPFKMSCIDKTSVIRNDNPQNLIFLDPKIENQLKFEKNYINLLESGYKQQEINNLQNSLKLYYQSLKYSLDDVNAQDISIQIYLNIANVLFTQQNYQKALQYCNQALQLQQNTSILDLKISILEKLQDFNQLIQILDKNSDIFNRVVQKSNMQKGIIDTKLQNQIIKSSFSKQKQQYSIFLQNFCNYYGPIEIKPSSQGRGLYATQNIQSGTILIIEEPLGAAEYFKYDQNKMQNINDHTLITLNNMPGMLLLNQLIIRCQNNPNLRKKLAQLHSGKFRQDCPDIQIDIVNQYYKEEPRQLPAKEIQSIIDLNSFGMKDENSKYSTVYHVISFINHQNNPNTTLVSPTERYGVILTTRNIKQGDQITMDYVPALKGEEKKQTLLKTWGIK
ncbi:SET_domain-containing protein [Hexamita inflata]|uniref:SET domain-containing protein n=1 Tax=Hexamita inflata TaxID=28002 RepID=A0AA86RCX6_9EUKA|nr:SET domain-containing protein [Hexamita inflata]